LHTSDRSQRLTALLLRLGERLMFLRGYRPMGGRARRFDGPAGGVHCRSERAVQPFGELLLQICCWCSSGLSEVQFLIAVEEDHGACLGGVVQLLCHKFRFSLSSGGSKMSR
jgi:hypothetical protein